MQMFMLEAVFMSKKRNQLVQGEGETLVSFWERGRLLRHEKYWAFWQQVCGGIRDVIYDIIELTNSWEKKPTDRLKLVADRDRVQPQQSKIERSKPEVSRGPPKGFIPIPKTETGGCARSDTAHP